MFDQFRRARNLQRYHRIISVFARHGFGSFLQSLQVDRYLPVNPALFRQNAPPTRMTSAEHFRAALEELGPTFIKFGQIFSTRPDIFPPAFVVELSKLQEGVTPTAWESMRSVLEQEYGCPPEEVFARVDPQPLGSASLSQVHAAELKDGTPVVLKIQRAGIDPIIQADLDILTDLARLAQRTPWGQLYNPVEIIAEFSYTLHNELDYRREGLNADRFRKNFEGDRRLFIPKVYWEYSTLRVLCLERLTGLKIDDLAGLDAAGLDRSAVAQIATEMVVKEIMEDGFFHADPHPGNFFVMPARPDDPDGSGPGLVIGAMDFGMVGYVSKTDRANLIQAYLVGDKGDTHALVEHLARIGAVPPAADTETLERDLDRLISQYRGLPLKFMETRRLMEELMQVAFRYRINLPPDMWLLFKTLTMLDGLARQLDPEYDVLAAFGPPVRRIFIDQRMPWVWGPEFMEEVEALLLSLRDVPAMGQGLLRNLRKGELPFSITMGANKTTLDRLDRVSTRISLSLLIAAFIVGLALLLPVSEGNQIALALVVIGFVAALTLGAWVVFSMLRSGK